MAIKYRNTHRGHVVTMAEPKEVERSAGKKQALHQLRTIVRMDASKRWERVESDSASKRGPGRPKKAVESEPESEASSEA